MNHHIARQLTRDLDSPRLLLLILPPLSLFFLFFLSLSSTPFSPLAPFQTFFSVPSPDRGGASSEPGPNRFLGDNLDRSRIAVCLVGGARRFELTGPSIVKWILKKYPNSDLFLHSPFDNNSFKFLLLNHAPRIAWVRIFKPQPLPESEDQVRVLTARNSPNGIQGLLQYFNLVEGCLTMIKSYQERNNFTYEWIIRTRVDGYWNGPLSRENFIPGHYVVPPGSSYGGLNDRLGIGDFNTSLVALSRLSLIPQLDAAGLRQLNSESAFRAQLTTQQVPYVENRIPFCIVSDRQYNFPPDRYGVPVASLSSQGPLSGAKCRPCKPVCGGDCVERVMSKLDRGWSWTNWENGALKLCDAHAEWEVGWELIFNKVAGKKLAKERTKVWSLKLNDCIREFEYMKRRTGVWEAPSAEGMCKAGLGIASWQNRSRV